MARQLAEPVFNPSTGQTVVVCGRGTDQLAVTVLPGTSQVKICDEYGFENFAYYKLVGKKVPDGLGIAVKPVVTDGIVGCQSVPEFPLSQSERSNWTEQDNADNSIGKAFGTYVVSFAPLVAGTGFTIELDRHVKYYYSITTPGGFSDGGGSGKYDKARPLVVEVRCQNEASFASYVNRQLWTA